MEWDNLGSNRLSRLTVMSGDRINQRLKVFRIQKFFWFVFVFFLVLAAISFSGKQLFLNSEGAYVQKNPAIEYPQLVSFERVTTWKIRLKESRQLWISNTLIEKMSLEEVFPKPEKIIFVDQRLFLNFKEAPEIIFLKIKPRLRGFIEGAIGGEREVFSITFLAFP